MKGSLHLLTIKGIKLFVHWSFPLLLIYILVSEWWKGAGFFSGILLGALVLAVFVAVVLHELGHALMARRYGCKTKDIILLPIGGMARMERLPEKPGQEIRVALAGPFVNACIAAIVYWVVYSQRPLPDIAALGKMEVSNWPAHFFYANVVLVLFNLIPAFPMDGGRVLRGLLSYFMDHAKATQIAARVGQVIALGMIALGLYANPFLIIIGLFVIVAAQVEAGYYTTRSILKDAVVGDVLMRQVAEVSAELTLREVMQRLLDTTITKFVVVQDGNPVGVLDRNSLMECIERHGHDVFVASCMSRELADTTPQSSLEELFGKLQLVKTGLAIVREQGEIKGYVDVDNILEFILYRKAIAKYNTAH
jgi:Zn-dependent protease/predicted transcriptional regulator